MREDEEKVCLLQWFPTTNTKQEAVVVPLCSSAPVTVPMADKREIVGNS
jgi:hypothetical protein